MVSGFTRKRLNAKAQRHKGFGGHELREFSQIQFLLIREIRV